MCIHFRKEKTFSTLNKYNKLCSLLLNREISLFYLFLLKMAEEWSGEVCLCLNIEGKEEFGIVDALPVLVVEPGLKID